MRAFAPTRLNRAEHVRSNYFQVVPEGQTLESALSPDFWAHTRKQLRLYDLFELVAEDGAFDALVRITSINNVTGEIVFRVLSNVAGAPAAQTYVPDRSDRFEVKSRGFGRYAVMEKETGNMVADGLSKEKAIETQQQAESQRKAA